jgi:hypothetical protein
MAAGSAPLPPHPVDYSGAQTATQRSIARRARSSPGLSRRRVTSVKQSSQKAGCTCCGTSHTHGRASSSATASDQEETQPDSRRLGSDPPSSSSSMLPDQSSETVRNSQASPAGRRPHNVSDPNSPASTITSSEFISNSHRSAVSTGRVASRSTAGQIEGTFPILGSHLSAFLCSLPRAASESQTHCTHVDVAPGGELPRKSGDPLRACAATNSLHRTHRPDDLRFLINPTSVLARRQRAVEDLTPVRNASRDGALVPSLPSTGSLRLTLARR